MEAKQERIEWVDLASGIMILWLMIFHALEPSIGTNITGKIPFLYFFMPWFFFKSGMLFKVKAPQTEFKNNFNKLIIQGFIKWSIIGYIALILDHWLIYNDLTARVAFYTPARSLLLNGSIPLNGALWFIPVLFIIRQTFNYLSINFTPPSLWIFIISGFTISAICHFANTRFIPSYIHSFGWGLCCFTAGYWYSHSKLEKKYVIILSAIVYVASLFTSIPDKYCVPQNHIISGLWIPASILSCIFFNYICEIIDTVKTPLKKVLSPFKLIGANSMIFYVSHYIVFRIVFDIIGNYKAEWHSSWLGLSICIICYFVVALITINYQKTRKYKTNMQ